MRREQELLLAGARARGAEIELLPERGGEPAALVELGGRLELFVYGSPRSLVSDQAARLFWDKQLTKRVLSRAGVPSPWSVGFSSVEEARPALTQALAGGAEHVAKPLEGTQGEGVELGITSLSALEAYLARWRPRFDRFMLETQVEGDDARLHVIDGAIVAACVREPANVVGDGAATLGALIAALQAQVTAWNPENELALDEATRALIAAQGLALSDTPASGQRVWLKRVANVAQGAIPVDITDLLHPRYGAWARAVFELTRHRMFAMDIMAVDPSVDPEGHAWAIEVNHAPNWLHHTFSQGRTHDIAGLILDAVFGPADC